ncbi:hypothetical protein RSAG8_11675, partial [Rhizoctonia solani AG-8 WAC10335]
MGVLCPDWRKGGGCGHHGWSHDLIADKQTIIQAYNLIVDEMCILTNIRVPRLLYVIMSVCVKSER